MNGKTIRIFLVDGAPTGVLTAEIINWTGKVIVAPRSQLSQLAKRDEIRRTGVYCLVGPDPESPHRDQVYLGEGDNVFTRLTAHDKGEGDNVFTRLTAHDKDETKDFWTRVVALLSKDENVTKSHGRYLESRLISLANDAGRARVSNGTAPPLPEPDIADMEYFLDQVQMILPVLGFNFLQPKPDYSQLTSTGSPEQPRFVMHDAGTDAAAVEVNGEFVVLKGSTARKQGSKSWDSYRQLREQLVEDGKLVDGSNNDYYTFAENVPFTSPSAAATVVAAGNRNGRLTWQVASSGQTYADWHDARLEQAADAVQSDDE